MSKHPWRRCSVSDISLAKLQFSDAMRDDETGIDTSLFPDCDLFNTRLIAQAAGFGQRVDHWSTRALCGSFFHLNPITAVNSTGHEYVIGWATHTQSAQWGGLEYRKAARDRQLAGKRVTDVSGGANLAVDSQPIETRVTGLEESVAAQFWRLSGPPRSD